MLLCEQKSAVGHLHLSRIFFLCRVKVLILHQHFNTPEKGGPLRSYYLAKALIAKGFEVSVITARQQALYSRETISGIDVHYLPIGYNNRFGFYKRGISFLRYALSAVRIAGKIKNISVCYAISVPLTVGQAALWIKKTYHIPFIFEVGDLWPDAPIQLGFIHNKVLQKSLFLLEKHIYRNAKRIVALSDPIAKAILAKTPGVDVTVIPNIADTDYYKPEPKDDGSVRELGVEGKYVVSYIGAVGFANGLDFFLECARASQKSELPVHFLLCGEGGAVDQLRNSATQLQLRNLSFVPFKNREGVRKVLNVTDATFISYRPFPILETGSPNKYFDGLAAGKLIIINFKGWIKDEIETEKCGFAVDTRYPHDFVNQLRRFLEDRKLENEYRGNARKLAERKYSRELLGKRFTDLFSM
jgi:glycosyltransferase involved in cell wall biosynthesis